MASYSFDHDHARQYGVNEAIFLQNIIHWIRKNHANGMHQYEDRTWTYNTLESWVALFPWLSVPQVRRIIAKLKRADVIFTAHFDGAQRRTYYTLVNECMAGIQKKPQDIDSECNSLEECHVPKSTDDVSGSTGDVPESTDGSVGTDRCTRARIHSDINLTDINQCPPTPQRRASVSLETIEDPKPVDHEIDPPESAFIPDLDPSSHLEDYHQLIGWFYDKTIACGWRKAPPPVGDQMRQARILLDYERQGYKLWAIRTMVEWHVKHHRARDRPIVSFDFFDSSRSKYATPMQEALEATWIERQQNKQPDEGECDVEGLERLNAMFESVCPSKSSDEHERRNDRFREKVRKQQENRLTRQAILERLDPPDKTIPTVKDLQPSQNQEAAG